FGPLMSNPTTHADLIIPSPIPNPMLPMPRNRAEATAVGVAGLPPDMLAHIQARLCVRHRLVLPGDTPNTATLFSLAYRRPAVVRAPGPDHLVLGSSSSRGWLVTADAFARPRLVNPVTGEQRAPGHRDHPLCLRVRGEAVHQGGPAVPRRIRSDDPRLDAPLLLPQGRPLRLRRHRHAHHRSTVRGGTRVEASALAPRHNQGRDQVCQVAEVALA
uniref:Uncharacterized protein n=7 Tax=Aegilops tauschii subsp. strangulata TaxID=200361 RepID=A0A453D718_AEGTS